MEILVKVAQFLLSLSILVVLHEFGHFLFARAFKTRVEKFYLFFNPWFEIFKFKRGDTEYGLGWLPLGGYVKISGMIDESMDKEQMKQPAQPHEFRSKPAWQRLLIMTGGVLVNFILALVIYSAVLYVWGEKYIKTENLKYGIACEPLAKEIGFRNGDKILFLDGKKIEAFHQVVPTLLLDDVNWVTVERDSQVVEISIPKEFKSRFIKAASQQIAPRIPFVISSVQDGSPANTAGIQPGDSLLAINGEKLSFYDQFRATMQANKNQQVNVTMWRNGEPVDLTVSVPETGIVGVNNYTLNRFLEISTSQYSFFASIPAGISRGLKTFSDYLKQLKLIFSPSTKAYESVGGFMTIGNIFPSTWDWQSFWELTAFLSIILAIMNMLPIPALDGGHVMFLLYEVITRRKPHDKFMEYAQIAGMIFILALVIFANANDVIKFFFK
jgi:regulator of sigma E protease